MFTKVKTPTILEEQRKVMEWSRKLRSRHIDFSSIIKYLVSDECKIEEL